MRIIVNQNKLLDCINTVQKAVPTKTTLSVLEGILFMAQSGKLTLTATDLELGIETRTDVDVLEPGSMVVDANIINDIVRKLPNSELEIEKKENFIKIKCQGSEFEILELPTEEFPQLPTIDRENQFTLPSSILKEMIRQTIFAVSTDEIRPILTGALMEVDKDKINMVALDGYRMAVKTSKILNDIEIKAVIPGKTLSEIGKIIDDKDEPVNIFISKNQILFNIEDTIVTSRLLEGEFINYSQLIPDDHKIKVGINKAEFLESCDRAALFASTIKFEIFDDIMNIKSNSEKGNVYEELSISKEGEDLEIAFNPRYIIEALKVINNEKIEIEYTSGVSPSIIRPKDDSGFLYLVLPVRRR